MDNVKGKTIGAIRNILDMPLTMDILPSHGIKNDLSADSLDLITIIMDIEEAFNIELSDESCEKVETVQDVIDLVYATI